MDPKEPEGREPGERHALAPADPAAGPTRPAEDTWAIGRIGDRFRRRRRLVLVLVPAALFLLVGWTKVVSSNAFCGSCHSMKTATISATRSLHSDVPCISCHGGSGAIAAVAYVPTMLREGVALTGLHAANGVLPSRTCVSCHPALSAAAHPNGLAADCTQCHGEVSHPALSVPGPQLVVSASGHPKGFIQTHGRSATSDPNACVECHDQRFCEACHLKETFPHPDGWISTHGKVEQQRGPTACETCHSPSFCAGCHGTEIPHRPDWLSQHATALQGQSITPCLTCHPSTDCTTCHAEHAVHREQDLYNLPPPRAGRVP